MNKGPTYIQLPRRDWDRETPTPMMIHSGHPDGMCNSRIAVCDEACEDDSSLTIASYKFAAVK